MASSKKKRSTKSKKVAAKAEAPAVDSKQEKNASAQPRVATATASKASTKQKKITTTALAEKPRFNAFAWNKWLAILHAIQGVVILVLSTTKTFPVTLSYLTPDPLGHSLVSGSHHLFDIDLAWLIAAFFFMSALAHTAMATFYRKRYEAELVEGVNRIRWIEYACSASTMLVAIALLSGVYDFSSLLMIFALTLVMNLLGLAMELYNRGKKEVQWLAYGIGCVAGIVPWIVLALYFIGANVFGDGSIPSFVYWIYGSIFVFFNSFAINMYLQYKKHGKWADYIYGERWYMILSLTAKTLLAWQIFAGALRP